MSASASFALANHSRDLPWVNHTPFSDFSSLAFTFFSPHIPNENGRECK